MTRRAAWLVFLLAVPAHAAAPPATLDECDARVAKAPRTLDACRCYWYVGRNSATLPEARRRLAALVAADPGNHAARLVLGAIAADLADPEAAALLAAAADGMAHTGNVEGEVHARVTRAVVLRKAGDPEAARTELERALACAERRGTADLANGVRIQLGWQLFREGDYGAAWAALTRAERALGTQGAAYLRLDVLDGLAAVAWASGRAAEALDLYGRQLALLGTRDPHRAAFVRRNIAVVALELHQAGQADADEVRGLAHEALDAATRAGHRGAATGAHLVLAELDPGAEGRAAARSALELARDAGSLDERCWALFVAGRRAADPQDALQLVDEGLSLARGHANVEQVALGLLARADLLDKSGPREAAREAGAAALDAIERIRDLQPDRSVRGAVFSRFADAYRRIAARAAAAADAEGLARAFAITERMRARALLDALDASGASAAPGRGPAAERRRAVLAEIAALQRTLAEAAGDPDAPALARLETLEREEAALRDDLARLDPRFGRARHAPVDAAAVRRELGAGQALVAYVVPQGPRAPREPWALVATREALVRVPLPRATQVETAVPLFVALLERRDGAAREGAARLYDALLRDVVAALPPGTRELIVVPDGALHRLPFDALTDGDGGVPVASRFDVALAPSAATWLRLRHAPPLAAAAVLAFADPRVPGGERTLPALRHARREAAALRVALGGEVLAGSSATEGALARPDLGRFGVLHFAAHTVVDDEHPERSAVLLAAATRADDGRLSVREIVDLPLRGHLVVLSACRGAAGPIVGGDGPAGLANAFFLAGARAVVAGLWPVRDDEAARLIERFATHLARGERVGPALAAARRELAAAGAPPAAWAGFVVLGDSGLTPRPSR